MKPYPQIKAERNAKQLSKKPLVHGMECHNCGWKLPVRGHFCSAACGEDYETEKAELLARDGK